MYWQQMKQLFGCSAATPTMPGSVTLSSPQQFSCPVHETLLRGLGLTTDIQSDGTICGSMWHEFITRTCLCHYTRIQARRRLVVSCAVAAIVTWSKLNQSASVNSSFSMRFLCPISQFFFPECGVGLVPKRGCLLTLAYYALPRLYEFGERRWNYILTGENRKTRRKTYPTVTLSTTNPTWVDPGTNPGLRGERPAINDLSHDTATISQVNITLVGKKAFHVFAVN
jgi:hypothetical protein